MPVKSASALPEPFQSRLIGIKESGRLQYLSGMIKNACQCEREHNSALIRLGISGGKGMGNYWVMYFDNEGQRCSFNAYSYINNSSDTDGHKPPSEDGTWTDDHITVDDLLVWALSGGAAVAAPSSTG
jgi:hypothetical protein